MFINPTIAIERGWIKGNINLNNIQPNAIDFTLDKMFEICKVPCSITETIPKNMRVQQEVPTYGLVSGHNDPTGRAKTTAGWMIESGSYDCMSDFYVEIPEGVAAYLIVRSTFNRNGMFITSGLYDSGFKGHIGFVLHNPIGSATIEVGIRVGQIIFISSDSAGVYAGGWNHQQGTHYSQNKAPDAAQQVAPAFVENWMCGYPTTLGDK